MDIVSGIFSIEFLSSIRQITMDSPVYLDLFKMLAGSIGWIGGLTLFMWFKARSVSHPQQ